MLGVKLPDCGREASVGVGVFVGFGVGVFDIAGAIVDRGVALGFGVGWVVAGVFTGVPDGVATKAGNSPA